MERNEIEKKAEVDIETYFTRNFITMVICNPKLQPSLILKH